MKRTVLFLYILGIVVIIILADIGILPLRIIAIIPHYDWIAHLILYGLLYGLMVNAAGRKKFCMTAVVFLLCIEEISQLYFTTRTFSLMDIFMGISGVFISYCIIAVFNRKLSLQDSV